MEIRARFNLPVLYFSFVSYPNYFMYFDFTFFYCRPLWKVWCQRIPNLQSLQQQWTCGKIHGWPHDRRLCILHDRASRWSRNGVYGTRYLRNGEYGTRYLRKRKFSRARRKRRIKRWTMMQFDLIFYIASLPFISNTHGNMKMICELQQYFELCWSRTRNLNSYVHLKENFPRNTCQIYILLYSNNVKMTLEFQIFVWKALGCARHFSPRSVTKLYTGKSNGRSQCPCSCSNLWRQSWTTHWPLLFKNHWSLFFTKEMDGLFGIDVTDLKTWTYREWLHSLLFVQCML